MLDEQRDFDLNIEDVLDNWEVYHALREIIANAIDEQRLTNTKNFEITRENNVTKIRDFGRGLSYEHLTQNENQEKLKNPELHYLRIVQLYLPWRNEDELKHQDGTYESKYKEVENEISVNIKRHEPYVDIDYEEIYNCDLQGSR